MRKGDRVIRLRDHNLGTIKRVIGDHVYVMYDNEPNYDYLEHRDSLQVIREALIPAPEITDTGLQVGDRVKWYNNGNTGTIVSVNSPYVVVRFTSGVALTTHYKTLTKVKQINTLVGKRDVPEMKYEDLERSVLLKSTEPDISNSETINKIKKLLGTSLVETKTSIGGIMQTSQVLLNKLNGLKKADKVELTQESSQKETVSVSLYSVLSQSEIVKAMKLGEDALLTNIRISGDEVVLEISKGKVERE